MKRILPALGLGLAAAGVFVLPLGFQQWQMVSAADDPVALSDHRLSVVLSPARLNAEIENALTGHDSELADSLIALASERSIPVAADQTARLQALKDGTVLQAATDFGYGFVAGARESGASVAGALVGDVIGYGDLRDLAIEGRKWADGSAPDTTVLAIAAAGLAISAATWLSIGSALPARNGLSAVKAASKAKVLSPAMTASLTRAATGAIDGPALDASLAAASRLNLAAARANASKIIRPAALSRLTALGHDAGVLYSRIGQRGLRQVLTLADDAGDIAKAAKLSQAKGVTTRAILKVLGRGALVLGALSLSAVGWMLTIVGYAIALAMLAQRIGWWLGRRLFPSRSTACLRRRRAFRLSPTVA